MLLAVLVTLFQPDMPGGLSSKKVAGGNPATDISRENELLAVNYA
jgi:hypothetical protein